MLEFILILAGTAFVIGAIYYSIISIRKSKVDKSATKALEEKLISRGFKVDKKIIYEEMAFFMDNDNKLWCAKQNNESGMHIHKFSDLIEFNLNENINKVEAKGGGDSSFLGLVMDQEAYEECTLMQIVINVRDSKQSKIKFRFIDSKSPEKKGSPGYKATIKVKDEMVAALKDIEIRQSI